MPKLIPLQNVSAGSIMRTFIPILFFLVAWTPQLACSQTQNQDCSDGVCQYEPQDPWQRTRFWLRQTGHLGLFYNCDCQEEKRFSPYICWQQEDCHRIQFWERMKCDWNRMRQRIADGACECKGRLLSKLPCRSDHCDRQTCCSESHTANQLASHAAIPNSDSNPTDSIQAKSPPKPVLNR